MKSDTKKFKQKKDHIENITYDIQENHFTCVEGRDPPSYEKLPNWWRNILQLQLITNVKTVKIVPGAVFAIRLKSRSSRKKAHVRKNFGRNGPSHR